MKAICTGSLFIADCDAEEQFIEDKWYLISRARCTMFAFAAVAAHPLMNAPVSSFYFSRWSLRNNSAVRYRSQLLQSNEEVISSDWKVLSKDLIKRLQMCVISKVFYSCNAKQPHVERSYKIPFNHWEVKGALLSSEEHFHTILCSLCS